MSDLTKTSKFLSYVLRHEPQVIGLALDAEGWASVEELIGKALANGHDINRETLLKVVETSDKKRFTLSDDGALIRAAQGHSVEVDLGLAPRSHHRNCCFTARRSGSLNLSLPKV